MAVLAIETRPETATVRSADDIPEWRRNQLANLRPFQKGHIPLPGAGRPKGSRDAINVILDAAPQKAKQYVKSTAPAVLVDARKWIMPIDSDHTASDGERVNLVIWLEQHLAPSILVTPTLQMPLPDDGLIRHAADSPTLSVSAGTETPKG